MTESDLCQACFVSGFMVAMLLGWLVWWWKQWAERPLRATKEPMSKAAKHLYCQREITTRIAAVRPAVAVFKFADGRGWYQACEQCLARAQDDARRNGRTIYVARLDNQGAAHHGGV